MVSGDRLLRCSLHGICLQTGCMLGAFPHQGPLNLFAASCAVGHTHAAQRLRKGRALWRIRLLFDQEKQGGNGLLAT
jgi:hypothetical protein